MCWSIPPCEQQTETYHGKLELSRSVGFYHVSGSVLVLVGLISMFSVVSFVGFMSCIHVLFPPSAPWVVSLIVLGSSWIVFLLLRKVPNEMTQTRP